MEKRKNRSDSYQYVLLEICCSHEMMGAFSNQDSIYHLLDPFYYDEEVDLLQDQLKEKFWEVVGTALTERQKEVIRMYCNNATQMEIAKKLKVNQSSITKSINGNVDYKKGKRTYGGALKKIMKTLHQDEEVKKILDRIMELREEKF